MSVGLGSKLVSTLGNPSSKLPLAVKDIVNSLGYTYFSYDAGGKVEGKDKFIDEFGTMAIWLGGIPFFRHLIDKTAYKAAKLNPGVDIRVISSKTPEYLKLAKQYAPTQEIKKDIISAADNSKTFKKLFYGKFAASTLLTLGAYFALTKVKQNITKKAIEKDFMANLANANDKFLSDISDKNTVFKAIKKTDKNCSSGQDNTGLNKKPLNPSFSGLESFMFNPVKNMLILDTGITTERLVNARSNGEFIEYAAKEGSLLFFMYFAGKHIQNGIEKLSEIFLKKPIKLDAKFLTSDELKQALNDKTIGSQLKPFYAGNLYKNASDADVCRFLFENQDNILVKAAKNSGVLQAVQVNGKEFIDSSKFIDAKKIKETAKQLINIENSFESSKESVQKYLSKTKGLKVLSTVANVGICCLALGYIVPKLIMKHREKRQDGSKEFHVKKEYEKQLSQELKFGSVKTKIR